MQAQPENRSFFHAVGVQTWLALACLLISAAGYAWLSQPQLPCRPPVFYFWGTYHVDDYPALLAGHNPLFTCFTVYMVWLPLLVIAGLALLVRPGRNPRRVAVIMALTLLITFLDFCGLVFGGDGTTLEEIQTAQFDARSFHLVKADTVMGGSDVYMRPVYLFECEPQGKSCDVTQVADMESLGTRKGRPLIALEVDGQVLNVTNQGVPIYTVAANRQPIPPLLASPEVITPGTAAQITRLSDLIWTGEPGTLRTFAIQWSGDGRTLAAAGSTGIWFYRFDGDSINTRVLNTDTSQRLLALSPDAHTLLTQGDDSPQTTRWDLTTDPPGSTFLKEPRTGGAAFSPDGDRFAVGAATGPVVYETSGSTEIRLPGLTPSSPELLAFGPDNLLAQSIFVYGPDGDYEAVAVYDIATRTRIAEIDAGKTHTVSGLSFLPNGDLIIATNEQVDDPAPDSIRMTIHLLERGKDTPLTVFTQTDDRGRITTIALTPDGAILAIAIRDTIHLWDTRSWTPLADLHTGDDPVTALAFSPKGTLLASISNGTIHFWGIAPESP